MLPQDVDLSKLAVLEVETSVNAASVFPADFCIAGADPEGLPAAAHVTPGYLVAAFADTPYDASDALWTLSRCWWSLIKATTSLVTLVFITALGGNGEAADAGEENSYLELHRQCLMQSPAPLIFAAQRVAGGSRRPRLLGGWNVSKSQKDKAAEWLNPRDWGPGWNGGGGEGGWNHQGAPRGRRKRDGYDGYEQAWPEEDWSQWDGETEDHLLESVQEFLSTGPKEVQELASMFAGRFNAVVRADPRSGYSHERKNDGSFKKWLLGAGFEASALFDRNKCLISLPYSKRTTRGTRGGRKNRGGDRAGAEHIDAEQDYFDAPQGMYSREGPGRRGPGPPPKW